MFELQGTDSLFLLFTPYQIPEKQRASLQIDNLISGLT